MRMTCLRVMFLLVGYLLPSHLVSGLSIDEFSLPAERSISSGASGAQTQWTDPEGSGSYQPSDGVIGNIRDGSVGCETYDNTSNVSASFTSGQLTVNARGASTPSLYLSYDGNRGWGTDLETAPFNGIFSSPVDLSNGGVNDAITFRFTSVSNFGVGFNDFRITLVQGYTGTGSPGTISYDQSGNLSSGPDHWYSYDAASEINAVLSDAETEQFFRFPMSSLVNANGQTATFNSVQAIQFHGCTNEDQFDYTLDYIRATPEPSTGLVLAFGFGFLGVSRRRRRR